VNRGDDVSFLGSSLGRDTAGRRLCG